MAAKKKGGTTGGASGAKFLDDDDDVSSEVAEIERERTSAPAVDDTVSEVTLDEDDEDDEEEEPEPPKRSRSEKKRARYSDLHAELAAANELIANQAREMAEVRGYLTGQAQSQAMHQQAPQQDPLRAAHAKTFEREEALSDEIRALAASDPERARARTPEFRQRIQEIALERSALEYQINQRAAAPYQQQAQEQEFMRRLAQANPDVFGDQGRLAYATGQYFMLKALGKPENLDTINEALEATRVHYRLPVKSGTNPAAPRPTPEQARRYGGVPSGGGAQRSGAAVSQREDGKRVVRFTPAMRRMAQELYTDLPPQKAMERYAREVILEDERKKR